MVSGFNHNIRYRGVVFHIQTEDSGIAKPQITTLLYRNGTIVASKKTDYSDIIRIDSLEKVVEDLMKEQHKDILRRLKSGEFDDRAFGPDDNPAPTEPNEHSHVATPIDTIQPPAAKPITTPKPGQSLDEIIFEYLTSEED